VNHTEGLAGVDEFLGHFDDADCGVRAVADLDAIERMDAEFRRVVGVENDRRARAPRSIAVARRYVAATSSERA